METSLIITYGIVGVIIAVGAFFFLVVGHVPASIPMKSETSWPYKDVNGNNFCVDKQALNESGLDCLHLKKLLSSAV